MSLLTPLDKPLQYTGNSSHHLTFNLYKALPYRLLAWR